MKKALSLVLASLALVAVLAACQQEETTTEDTPTPTGSSVETPAAE